MAEPEPQFNRVRPMRASTYVIQQIREAIFSGRYKPGDRLPTEREQALQFGVSRVTVRDALRALEAARRAHTELWQAISRRDSETAIRLMRDHLYEFAERAERAQSEADGQ